jgi:hypothetical protein
MTPTTFRQPIKADILLRPFGADFILTPVTQSAREVLSLRCTGTSEVLVKSVTVDVQTLVQIIRWCDREGYTIAEPVYEQGTI